jgi:hypothetical protein
VQFMARIIRAAKLESRLYEEVKTDEDATIQALIVVLLYILYASIGASMHAGVGGMVMGGLVALLAWYIWTLLTYILGIKLFPISQTSASHRELSCTLGFASAPGVLRVFGVSQDLPGLRFSLPPCGCLLLRLLQYGRH